MMTSVQVRVLFVLIFAVVQLSAAQYVVYGRLTTIDVSLSLNPNRCHHPLINYHGGQIMPTTLLLGTPGFSDPPTALATVWKRHAWCSNQWNDRLLYEILRKWQIDEGNVPQCKLLRWILGPKPSWNCI